MQGGGGMGEGGADLAHCTPFPALLPQVPVTQEGPGFMGTVRSALYRLKFLVA